MTLENMRINGVRAVIATCEACGHKADVNVALPENVTVPEKADAFGAASAEGSGSTRDPHGIQRAIVTAFPTIDARPMHSIAKPSLLLRPAG
jgi:hypothetical protein